MNIEKFKPKKKGVSDKFSWNLYQEMKRYRNYGDFKVFRIAWSPIYGKVSLDKGALYMVFIDGVFPVCGDINRICSAGKKAVGAVVGFSGCSFSSIEKEDITSKFFSEYERIGRCLFIDGAWSHDFISINKNSRKCRHCGVFQKRTVKSKRIIKRVEEWK